MAIMTNPADYAASMIKFGPKTASALLYVAIGAVAIAAAVPAAIATSSAGQFEECYSSCVAVGDLASN
jgi:hypothetical protein